MANFSNLDLYGKQYNIGVANTYGTNVLACQNLAEASVIIAAATTEDGSADNGIYSLLATDSTGSPVRLTYTVKSKFHGIDTIAEPDVMQLNIDEHSIKAENTVDGTENTLYVDTQEIADQFSVLTTSSNKLTYQVYVNASSLTGTVSDATDTLHASVDNPTLEFKEYLSADKNGISYNTYLSVITKNLDTPKKSDETSEVYDIPGVVKIDPNEGISVNDKGYISVNFDALTDGWGSDPEFTVNPNKLITTVPDGISKSGSLTIIEDNLRKGSSTTYGVIRNDGLTSILDEGVLSVDASLLSYGSSTKCGVFKIDGKTIKTKTYTQRVSATVAPASRGLTAGLTVSQLTAASKNTSLSSTYTSAAKQILYNNGVSYNTSTGKLLVSQSFINNLDSTILGYSNIQSLSSSVTPTPTGTSVSGSTSAPAYVPFFFFFKTSNLYDTVLNTKVTVNTQYQANTLRSIASQSIARQYLTNTTINTGALYVDTSELQKADGSYYGVVRLAQSGSLYLNQSGDLDVDSTLISKATTTQYGTVKYDGSSLQLNSAGQLTVNSYTSLVQQIQTLLDAVNGLQLQLTEAQNDIITLQHTVNNVTTTTKFTDNGVNITTISMSITSGTDLYQIYNMNVTTTKAWLFTVNSPDANWIRSVSMIFTTKVDGTDSTNEYFGQSVIEQVTNQNVILKVYVNSFIATTKMERRGTINISVFDATTVNGVAESSDAVYKFSVIVQQSSVVMLAVRDVCNNLYGNFCSLLGQYTTANVLSPRPSQTVVENVVKNAVNTYLNTIYNWTVVNDVLYTGDENKITDELVTHDSVTESAVGYNLLKAAFKNYTWKVTNSASGIYYNSSKTHLYEYVALYGLILLNKDSLTTVNTLYDVITTNYWFTTPYIVSTTRTTSYADRLYSITGSTRPIRTASSTTPSTDPSTTTSPTSTSPA